MGLSVPAEQDFNQINVISQKLVQQIGIKIRKSKEGDMEALSTESVEKLRAVQRRAIINK